MVCSTWLLLIQPFPNPLLDIPPSISHVPTHPEPRRTFAPVSPLVQGSDRDAEVPSQLCNRQQPLVRRHGPTLRPHPFGSLSNRLSDLYVTCRSAMTLRASPWIARHATAIGRATSRSGAPTAGVHSSVCLSVWIRGCSYAAQAFRNPFEKGLATSCMCVCSSLQF